MARRIKKLTKDEMDSAYDAIIKTNHSINDLSKIKIELKFKNKNQKTFADHLENKEVIICSGPAGTGKTYVACAKALQLIKERPEYKKIYIVKSVTTLKDEEIGFLKGTM